MLKNWVGTRYLKFKQFRFILEYYSYLEKLGQWLKFDSELRGRWIKAKNE